MMESKPVIYILPDDPGPHFCHNDPIDMPHLLETSKYLLGTNQLSEFLKYKNNFCNLIIIINIGNCYNLLFNVLITELISKKLGYFATAIIQNQYKFIAQRIQDQTIGEDTLSIKKHVKYIQTEAKKKPDHNAIIDKMKRTIGYRTQFS